MIEEPVLVDTGAFIALFNANDPAHAAFSQLAMELPLGKVYTCWPVITEAAYLLRKYRAQRDALLDAVAAGEFQLLQIDCDELPAIRQVLLTYNDQDIDLADATLVYLANREAISTALATDLRHFRRFRLNSGKYFRILPTDLQ
jgi:predicted nucleic acid-binding protein